MINFIKKPVVIALLIVALGGAIGGYIYFGGDNAPAYDFIVAEKRDLIQEVSVTGRVKPAESVGLAFEKSGKVSRVYADAGDKVGAGQTLVALENSELAAQLTQAQSTVKSAEASLAQYEAALLKELTKLDELKRGTRLEEIQIAETKVANAKKALTDAKINLANMKSKAEVDLDNLYGDVPDILQDALAKADDALHKQIDELFTGDDSNNPQLSFMISNSQAEIDVEFQRLLAGRELQSLEADIGSLTTDQTSLDAALGSVENRLVVMRDFLARLLDAVNFAAGISQSSINTYKANINTARTNVIAAITDINGQKQAIATQKVANQKNIAADEGKVNDAENALSSAEAELSLKRAGSTGEQIAAQEAQVKQAEANVAAQRAQISHALASVQNIQAQIAKTILRAPISSVITIQNAKVGEIVSANTVIVSLISEAKFEIEANVPEADIAKVSAGNTSLVTLDAYGRDVVFEAKVVAVDPAETIVDGVATYKATFQFTKEDERVKSGMTANIDIASDSRENVIVVPQRAIVRKNGDQFVRIVNGESFKEVKVETGLRGSDGNIEIISGISEGDRIITFSEEE